MVDSITAFPCCKSLFISHSVNFLDPSTVSVRFFNYYGIASIKHIVIKPFSIYTILKHSYSLSTFLIDSISFIYLICFELSIFFCLSSSLRFLLVQNSLRSRLPFRSTSNHSLFARPPDALFYARALSCSIRSFYIKQSDFPFRGCHFVWCTGGDSNTRRTV